MNHYVVSKSGIISTHPAQQQTRQRDASGQVVWELTDVRAPQVYGELRVLTQASTPTPAEITTAFSPSYRELRARAYPPMQDYLDGIVKQDSPDPVTVAQGAAQVAAYKAACLAVKTQFPKPE